MSLSKEQLIEMYRIMQTARLFDKRVSIESKKGKLLGMFHFGTNQEAVDAGIYPCLKPEDYIRPYHRNHGCLQKCDINDFVAGLMERSTGYNNGVNGDFQQQDIEKHLLPLNGLVGEDWLYDTGVAMALKFQSKPGVVVCIQGDGAAQMGSLYEAMNFASLFALPIVYVVENNGVAMTTPTSRECTCENISDRAYGFDLKGVSVYGQDPIAVYDAMSAAIDDARNGQPSLVEIKTYRTCGHYFGDQREYVDPEYDQKMKELYPDPIPLFEQKLIDMGVATQDELKSIANEIKKQIADAFEYAYGQPLLKKEEIVGGDKVFSNTEGGMLQ